MVGVNSIFGPNLLLLFHLFLLGTSLFIGDNGFLFEVQVQLTYRDG